MLNYELHEKLTKASQLESIFDPAETKQLENEEVERVTSRYK